MSIPALTPFPVIVIGGGISGLACAYRLQQAGIPVRLLDASNRPGGVISTAQRDGFLFERGPQSFLSTGPLLELIASLGLAEELLRADAHAPRYILHRGKLVSAPLAPPSLLTSSLLGFSTKWRLCTEILRRSRPPANDESIASFVRRKFGDDLLDRMVGPFVSGVYAGDPEKLSLRSAFPAIYKLERDYGSVLRGAIKSRPAKGSPRPGLCSFRNGMETLPRALGAKLGHAFMGDARVTGIRRGKANGRSSNGQTCFEIDIAENNRQETLTASSVIVAAPTDAAGRILQNLSPQYTAHLSKIEYAPLAVVAAGYRRDRIQHSCNGFGFLVPRSEGLRILGTVWNSSLFPGRAPEGTSCFTSFVGGATDPAICDLDDGEIADVAGRELGKVLGISGPPVTRLVHRYARAIPQYHVGHSGTIAALAALTCTAPGLFFAGNWLSGPSIGACVEQANRVSEQARIYLASMGVAGHGAVAHT